MIQEPESDWCLFARSVASSPCWPQNAYSENSTRCGGFKSWAPVMAPGHVPRPVALANTGRRSPSGCVMYPSGRMWGNDLTDVSLTQQLYGSTRTILHAYFQDLTYCCWGLSPQMQFKSFSCPDKNYGAGVTGQLPPRRLGSGSACQSGNPRADWLWVTLHFLKEGRILSWGVIAHQMRAFGKGPFLPCWAPCPWPTLSST